MLDRKYILENIDLVRQNCVHRGVSADVDQLVALEGRRRELARSIEELNRRANEVAKTIGQAKDPAEREARKEAGRKLREEKDSAQAEHDQLEREITQVQSAIPNMTHPDAPIGATDDANRDVKRGRTPIRQFDFQPLDHVDLNERLQIFDLEAGARTTGAGFYFLKNEGVLLELALQRYVLSILMESGFTPMTTPDLAQNKILEGIGFNPRGPETQVYSVENSELSLVGTAEITLGGLCSGLILEGEQLPLRFCGISHCFRTEAGAAGRATRGIYRVHQFTKVEMFAYTLPEASDAMHAELCEIECRIFDGLGIPYRVIDTCTGDLGGPAYRKFDLEAWMPGRGKGGEWGEITSTSNCTDYQARRLDVRFKMKGEKGTRYAHTLNGTAVAITRAIIAIVENYQQADGSVVIPEVLRPWVGCDVIRPRS